eukprot:2972959-Amphidinium_carterae.2
MLRGFITQANMCEIDLSKKTCSTGLRVTSMTFRGDNSHSSVEHGSLLALALDLPQSCRSVTAPFLGSAHRGWVPRMTAGPAHL